MERRMFIHLSVVAAMGLAALGSVAPQGASPFVGHWQAVDPSDGSDMRLAIGGPPDGPFKITWTEDYLSACGGEAGIGRGTGSISADHPDVLVAHLAFECPTIGSSIPYDITWRFHSGTDTLSSRDGAVVTIWQHAGRSESLPQLDLRVNYGHDWVESFHEAGHTVWITVTEEDGETVKATAELVTEPKDFWGGEPGFATEPSDWDPRQPDIQPLDWVYGTVDDGQTAQVQIGEISGTIDLGADVISGTIAAPWLDGEVNVECFPWGAPEPQPVAKSDAVQPDGVESYSCSWAGEWDIQPYQDVGVGYFGPDGHWVANAFFASDARIVASTAGDWFWTTGFLPLSLLKFTIYDSQGGSPLIGGTVTSDDSGFAIVGSDVHHQDLLPDHYVVITDGATQKGLLLESITIDEFDLAEGRMAGSAPAGRRVLVVAADSPEAADQLVIDTNADADGKWTADFEAAFTEEWRPWSFAQIFDGDGDANEAGPPAPPEPELVWAWAFTYDLPAWAWTEGEHSYYFEMTYTVPDPGGSGTNADSPLSFTVDSDAVLYDGLVLLRPYALRVRVGADCPALDPRVIDPEEDTRFVWGWATDFAMTYPEAVAQYDSMNVWVHWDAGPDVEMARREIVPADEFGGYVCSLTLP